MTEKQQDVARQLVVIVTFVLTLVANFFGATVGLNGLTTGEVSDLVFTYFTPAGWAFSIWSVIYTGLIAYTIYQALPGQRTNPRLRRSGWLFAASSLVNAAWLFAWHYAVASYWLSVLLMVGILGLLLAIYIRLDIGRPRPGLGWADRLLVHLPFSIYVAWICVATVANVSSAGAFAGWAGFAIAAPTWAIIMIFVAAGVAALVLAGRANLPYAAVFVWALLAIRDQQGAAEPAIATAVLIAVGVVVAAALLGYVRIYRSGGAAPRLQPTS